jgi:hypothetical protein
MIPKTPQVNAAGNPHHYDSCVFQVLTHVLCIPPGNPRHVHSKAATGGLPGQGRRGGNRQSPGVRRKLCKVLRAVPGRNSEKRWKSSQVSRITF